MDDVQKLFGFLMAVVIPFSIAFLVIGFGRIMMRRLASSSAPSDEVRAELEELRARVAEQDAVQGRVLELEERLDFAERLLTQQREAAPLPKEGRDHASR